MRINEYDDGYGSKEDFERAGADQPGDDEGYDTLAESQERDARICPACNSEVFDADESTLAEMETHRQVTLAYQRVLAYDKKLDELEIAPNGDDYNNLLDILAGAEGIEPHTEGR